MRFMLDTSLCIDYLRGNSDVRAWVHTLSVSSVVTSAIAVNELEVGMFLTGNQPPARRDLNSFLRRCRPLPFDRAAAKEGGRIVAALGIKNNPTGYRDAMIAGHAVSLGLTVATRNAADFFKAPGVKVHSFA